MRKCINFILALLKWPVAVCMVFLFLPALKADIITVYDGLTIQVLEWFFLPVLVVLAIWLLIPGLSGSFLSILEHEVTHMIFALLTFHSPQDINIRPGVGGNFAFSGRGNWLIFIAPYFFPTSAALVIAAGFLYIFTGETPSNYYWLVLGIMTGYHLVSTLDEIHVEQTDFKVAGYLFSILFLPGANLLTYGFLMSFACYGFKGWGLYLHTLHQEVTLFARLWGL